MSFGLTLEDGGIPVTTPSVRIITTGSTFHPSVTLAPGSSGSVYWIVSDVVVGTGLSPTINFGSSATRTVRMYVTDSSGFSLLGDVTVFNIGFDHTIDNGISSLDSSYDWTPQSVSGLRDVRNMTGLVTLCAMNMSALVGTLDCSGLGQLQHLEVYGSSFTSVFISGCNQLVRLAVEVNNLTSMDITPASATLQDLRSAVQQSGVMNFAPVGMQMKSLWHYCVRDQNITNFADLTLFPNLQQVWNWNTRQSGTLKTSSPLIASVKAQGNQYTAADFSGNPFVVTLGPDGNVPDINVDGNHLTSLNLSGCTGLKSISARDNAFNQAAVDSILATVDGWGTSNGTLLLEGNPAPSVTTHVTALQGRGWTVTTGPGAAITVVQFKQASGASGLTFDSTPTLHNTIVYIVAGYTNASAAMSSSNPRLNGSAVTGAFALFDNGVTNSIRSPFNAGTGVYLTAWVLPNVPAANVLSLTQSGVSGNPGCIAYEIAGLGTTPSRGPFASGSHQTNTTIDGGYTSLDTTLKSFVVGLTAVYNQASAGPVSPWTSTSPNGPIWAGYRICNATATGENFAWKHTANSSGNPWAAGWASIHA